MHHQMNTQHMHSTEKPKPQSMPRPTGPSTGIFEESTRINDEIQASSGKIESYPVFYEDENLNNNSDNTNDRITLNNSTQIKNSSPTEQENKTKLNILFNAIRNTSSFLKNVRINQNLNHINNQEKEKGRKVKLRKELDAQEMRAQRGI